MCLFWDTNSSEYSISFNVHEQREQNNVFYYFGAHLTHDRRRRRRRKAFSQPHFELEVERKANTRIIFLNQPENCVCKSQMDDREPTVVALAFITSHAYKHKMCFRWLIVICDLLWIAQRSQSKLWSICASNSEKIHYIRLDLSLNADKLKLQTEFLCFLDENRTQALTTIYILSLWKSESTFRKIFLLKN